VRILDDFYKVGYIYEEKQKWAVYFNLESAQEAMIKMIGRGLEYLNNNACSSHLR
jgi:hypothetical protein